MKNDAHDIKKLVNYHRRLLPKKMAVDSSNIKLHALVVGFRYHLTYKRDKSFDISFDLAACLPCSGCMYI